MINKFNKKKKLCIFAWFNIMSGVVGVNDEWTHKINIFLDNNNVKIRVLNRGFCTDYGVFNLYKFKLSETNNCLKKTLISIMAFQTHNIPDLYNNVIENYKPYSTLNLDIKRIK